MRSRRAGVTDRELVVARFSSHPFSGSSGHNFVTNPEMLAWGEMLRDWAPGLVLS